MIYSRGVLFGVVALAAALALGQPQVYAASEDVLVYSLSVPGNNEDGVTPPPFQTAGAYKVVIRGGSVLFDITTPSNSNPQKRGTNEPLPTYKWHMRIDVQGTPDTVTLGDEVWYTDPDACANANINQFTVLQLPEDGMTVNFKFVDATPYGGNTGQLNIDVFEYDNSPLNVTVFGNRDLAGNGGDAGDPHTVTKFFQPGTYRISVDPSSKAIMFHPRTSDSFFKISVRVEVFEQSEDEGSIIETKVLGDQEFLNGTATQPAFRYDPNPADNDDYVHNLEIDAFLHNQDEFVTITIPEVPDNADPAGNFRTQKRIQDGTEVRFSFTDPEGDYANNDGSITVLVQPDTAVQNIPTLSEWGLIAFVGLLLGYMLWTLGMRRVETAA